MVVFNDPVTRGRAFRSPPVARAQGFYIRDSKSLYNAQFGIGLVFNSTEHRSTLNIMGTDIIMDKVRFSSSVAPEIFSIAYFQ